MGQGTLWVCATPIGHLQDVSFRLIETLRSVDLIAAEDTRVTAKLCSRYNITTKTISLQKYNEASRAPYLIEQLNLGKSTALVSDAGTPNICDPGAYLIEQIRAQGIPISPIPGPSALSTFLSVCGVLTNQFFFAGFLPSKPSELSHLISPIEDHLPLVAFESGKRLLKTLQTLHSIRPITHLALGKELTKQHETVFSGTFETVIPNIENTKGEWIILIQFEKKPPQDTQKIVKDLKTLGLTPKQILHIGTNYLQLPKNALYHTIHHD